MLKKCFHVVLVAFVISLSGTYAVGDVCTTLRSGSVSQGYDGACTGGFPNQSVGYSETWNVWIRTACQDGGWWATEDPSTELSVTAIGECWDAREGEPPVCQGEIFGPFDRGTSGGYVQVTLEAHDIKYQASINNCVVTGGGRTSRTSLSAPGCQGGFCCSLANQCAQVGRQWSAATCACVDASPCPGSCPDPEAVGPTDYCQYPDTGCPSPQINYGTGCCYYPTPIILDIEGNGFSLTDIEHGVLFPLRSTDEIVFQTAWTRAGSDDAWLVLDRNGNGKVDNGSELFGSSTPQPEPPTGQGRNGFLALAEYDKPPAGGNADGWIDAADSVYSSLRLWQDVNHDGVSQPEELHTLAALGISAIELDYKSSRRIDEFGNEFRYRAKVTRTRGGEVGRWAFDVILRAIVR